MKSASVVVVNYNGGDNIAQCLDHLLVQDHPDYHVIMVDNGSVDGSLERAQRIRSSRLQVIANGRNLGCGAGRNVGIARADGEVVAFVDDDAFAEKSWLRNASMALESDDSIGVVASKSVFHGDRAILNSLGGRINLQGYGMDLGFGEPLQFWQASAPPLYATGNGLTTRREVLARIGGFDPLFFNYYDDVDFSIRAWMEGFAVREAPDAVLYHVVSHSDRKLGRKTLLCERNRIRNVLKHYDGRMLASWLPREIRYELSGERSAPARIFAKAWLWNLGHLPSLLAYRLRRGGRQRLASHPALEQSWGSLGGKYHNMSGRPGGQGEPGDASRIVDVGADDAEALRFGWFHAEQAFGERFRWSDDLAALTFRVADECGGLRIRFMFPPGVQGCDVHVLDQENGRGVSGRIYRNGRYGFCEEAAAIRLRPSVYQLLFQPDTCHREPRGAHRRLGIGVSRLELLPSEKAPQAPLSRDGAASRSARDSNCGSSPSSPA